MLTPTPFPDPAALVLLPESGYLELLALALVVAVSWLIVERHRGRVEARDRGRWELAYWHLLATATCPLCGSRMEPAPTTPAHEARRGDLS